jgi:GntR family transcriptional regulator/MocR family aminotransferase
VSELLDEGSLLTVRATRAKPPSPAAADLPPPLAGPVPFRPCQPDVRLFPLALWNRARTRALRRHGTRLLDYHPEEPLGLPSLRRSLAAHLEGSRAVRCDWRQIAVTGGSQQALFMLSEILLKPGDVVGLEDPGYLGARLAFEHARAALHPLPVDAAGLRLPGRASFAPKLLYTTPSRQFPTGSCLSLARRLELVAFAARKGAWVVEDDYDSEFRYSRGPLPSLHSLDRSDRVIYVGSASKALFPSLRLGYVVLPSSLVEPFANLRAAIDEHGPVVDQATLAEFLESGALYSHIRRSRREYGARMEVFVEAAERLGLPLAFPHADGGMNLAGFLAKGRDDAASSRRLEEKGLDIRPLSRYALRPVAPGLVFGFTAFEPAEIRRSLERAASALEF